MLISQPGWGDSPKSTPSGQMQTPKKQRAFKIICKEEGLSPHSLAMARRVFRGDTDELADEYLSFDISLPGSKEACSLWLADEISHVQHSIDSALYHSEVYCKGCIYFLQIISIFLTTIKLCLVILPHCLCNCIMLHISLFALLMRNSMCRDMISMWLWSKQLTS